MSRPDPTRTRTRSEREYQRFTRNLEEQFEAAKKNPDVPKGKAFTVALGTTMRTFEIVGDLL